MPTDRRRLRTETALIEEAVAFLSRRLPERWAVQVSAREVPGPYYDVGVDAGVEIRDPSGTRSFVLVRAKPTFGPRDVDLLLGGLGRALRSLASDATVLVVAPWLSARTQELLRRNDLAYLDLTGNVRLVLDHPGLFVETTGASRDPSPKVRGAVGLRGAVAGRVVRLLVDARPPYGVSGLASKAGVSPGYVSRLLETLGDEALVRREGRGPVTDVDWPALLRRRAESYRLFDTNDAVGFVAPRGARAVLEQLAQAVPAAPGRWAATGSFAAVRVAPVAAPALLVAYVAEPEATGAELGLLPAAEGADVVLARAHDPVVYERRQRAPDGAWFVAPSQLVLDCLTGNGRMPAEGEAVLAWMEQNEPAWRAAGIDDLPPPEAVP